MSADGAANAPRVLRLPSGAQLAPIAAVILTMWRSLSPIIGEELNSDEALVALMAKHLSEGRAFPLFLYSLPHILGIESWIAALFFLVGGPSVVMLKVPLALMNATIAWLLVSRLQRDVRLCPAFALLAALPFVLAPPHLSHHHYMDASGANPEPLLVILLLWVLRHRPLAFGIVLGLGILNRPFAAYGAAALLLVQGWDRSILQSRVSQGWLTAGIGTVAVWDVTSSLRVWASASGPGTAFDEALPSTAAANLGFVCFDPSTILSGSWDFASKVLPFMLGGSDRTAQLPSLVGVTVVAVLAVRLLWIAGVREATGAPSRTAFAIYLTAAGVLATGVYIVARCGFVDVGNMRYTLVTPLALVGLLGLLFAIEPMTVVRRLLAVVVCLWGLFQFVDHTRLLVRAVSYGPTSPRRDLARYLEREGVRYAWADYWDAQVLTFLTTERVIVASENVARIVPYQRQVSLHSKEALKIRHRPCTTAGREAVRGVYWVGGSSEP
jgi:hypothetical protein